MAKLFKEIQDKIKQDEDAVEGYSPEGDEAKLVDYLKKRIEVLKDSKKNILNGLNYEDIMRSADIEYSPKLYTDSAKTNKQGQVFIQDEINGLRGSRLVQGVTNDKDWKSNVKATTLYEKVQVALSIIINQNPDATFKATLDKYKQNSSVAKAIWKRSWELPGGKNTLKLFIFDLAKYGWGIGKTYPRILKRDKEILEELDLENPDNNVYRKDKIVEFNDIFRKRLDPFRTWIDDQTNLADPFSMRDWYYEEDYSKEAFEEEFGMYPNAKYAKFGSTLTTEEDGIASDNQTSKRDDLITVGFYESKKDIYTIWLPDQNIPVYKSPLPNDDGKLSCWWSYWTLRDPRTPYGIGLYEIIKNDKILYDRLSNMTVDQLVMAIYPMLFYSGPPTEGSGEINLSPNTIKQKLPSTTIDQIKVQYDQRGWEGTEKMQQRMDNSSAITPTLEGEVEGKTLGEVLHAKDSALKRLSIPLGNIADAIQQDAYITLSWANQIYSTPEIKEFFSVDEMESDIKETGLSPDVLGVNTKGKIEASYYPQLDLGLEEDRDGVLIESPEDRFMSTYGLDIKWEGRVIVKAESIVVQSQELERQRKLELFNLVSPVVQTMAMLFYQQVDPKTGQAFTPEGGKETSIALYKPLKQILEIQDEEPKNWIPKDILLVAENPDILKQQKMAEEQKKQEEEPMFVDQNSQEASTNQTGATPQKTQPLPNTEGNGVVPQNEISNSMRASLAQIEKPR